MSIVLCWCGKFVGYLFVDRSIIVMGRVCCRHSAGD